jgi:hypothetical protein
MNRTDFDVSLDYITLCAATWDYELMRLARYVDRSAPSRCVDMLGLVPACRYTSTSAFSPLSLGLALPGGFARERNGITSDARGVIATTPRG